MNRKPKPPPVPPVLWMFLIVFVFLLCVQIADMAYTAGEHAGEAEALRQVESFRQGRINALADLMQEQNKKLYRAKAEHYARLVVEECNRQGLEYLQLVAQMLHESGLREDATGGVGEIGLMQICPWWLTKADILGLDPISERELYDPVNNVKWGVAILKRCLGNTHGDLYKALCFYNAGPRWENGKGYANKVLRLRSMLEKQLQEARG